MSFRDRYGPWAVVVGGSEGIGAAYAEELARRGVHLVLLALDTPALDETATSLRDRYGVDVRTLAMDLAEPSLLDRVRPVVEGLDVGLLVYNAAASPIGEVLDVPSDTLQAVVDVNVRGPLLLVRELGPRLVDRGRGGIVLMSSLAATQGSAMVATYAASKAFNRVLAEGLWEELGRHGVDVLAVTPGTTDTPGFRASRPRGGPRPMSAAQVAREALDALGDRPVHAPGWANRLVGQIMRRALPRGLAIRLMSRETRRMYDRSPQDRR